MLVQAVEALAQAGWAHLVQPHELAGQQAWQGAPLGRQGCVGHPVDLRYTRPGLHCTGRI